MPSAPDLVAAWPGTTAIRDRAGAALDEFLAGRTLPGTEAFRPLPAEVIAAFLRGGERIGPLFCAAGALAGGGDPFAPAVVRVGAALELFHAFALIHDDIMAASGVRRQLAEAHEDPRFGTAGAILIGDLCLVWSQELIEPTGIAARPFVTAMRTEAIAGQYLAIDPSAPPGDEARAWKATRLRSASSLVRRPLQIGAALAGAPGSTLAFCTAYGTLVGEAFQLRDDLFGVLGDPSSTGKRTVLMSLAWRHADSSQRRTISARHGDPDLDEEGAAALRAVIRATGADRMVGELITDRTQRALAAVRDSGLSGEACSALTELAYAATTSGR